ncbi:hypothetical protein GCM10010440_72360 [Kitasatospora cinereorecta]
MSCSRFFADAFAGAGRHWAAAWCDADGPAVPLQMAAESWRRATEEPRPAEHRSGSTAGPSSGSLESIIWAGAGD